MLNKNALIYFLSSEDNDLYIAIPIDTRDEFNIDYSYSAVSQGEIFTHFYDTRKASFTYPDGTTATGFYDGMFIPEGTSYTLYGPTKLSRYKAKIIKLPPPPQNN